MEEWMQAQQQQHYQGRSRSYSMSHADNISSFYHQLQQKPQPQQQAAFPQPLPHHQPAAMMTDSFLQEGSPLSMSSSCGSDDAAYSSDYAPQLQSMGTTTQQNGYEQHPPQATPAHLQRRASLSSTPGGVGASLGILGGFVGEGLRAEYASRRPGGRRKSICLSPSQQQDEQMNVADHYQAQPSYTSVPDSEAAESAMDAMAAVRRNSLPAANARRNSLSCPLVHNYTPLTAVPTLGRALAEGNLGQRKSIQSFLSMLAQSSNDRSDKRRKRKSSRKDRGKRYKRSDYDESSDDEDDDSSEEGNNHATANGQNPFPSPGEHDPSGAPFSGFDYSSGALAAEGSVSSDSSSDTIPSSAGDQSTPSPFEPITPMGSAELFPPYSSGADVASSSTYGGMGTTRPRSRSSPPSYVDSQVPLTHQQQLQRQYHIAQTNKRLQELRQQHLERLQRQMEMERQQAQQQQQQRHSYEYASTTQRYAAQPFQAQQSGYPPQAHVLGLEVSHQARMTGPQLVHQPSTSASLPSVLPSHDLGAYHQYGPEIMRHQQQPEPLAQELIDPQARADFDFYNEFSDFNMCEPASMESLYRTVPEDGLVVAHQAPVTSIPVGSDQLSTDDGPVSEILVDEFSVVPSSAFAHESWLGAGGASEAAPDASSYPSGLAAERKEQQNDDAFSEFFNLDDAGMGASH